MADYHARPPKPPLKKAYLIGEYRQAHILRASTRPLLFLEPRILLETDLLRPAQRCKHGGQ